MEKIKIEHWDIKIDRGERASCSKILRSEIINNRKIIILIDGIEVF